MRQLAGRTGHSPDEETAGRRIQEEALESIEDEGRGLNVGPRTISPPPSPSENERTFSAFICALFSKDAIFSV